MKEKRDLDGKDLEILQLLTEDARRPYSDLADHVGLSPPAVSDRIDRLEGQGVIRQFTIDIDRLKLQHRTPVMVTIQCHPTDGETLYEQVCNLSGVEHAFKQFDGTVIAYANAPEDETSDWLSEGIDMSLVTDLGIELIERYDWTQKLEQTEFALPCPVCDKVVRSNGVTTEIGGETLAFCCPSCKKAYERQYEQYQANSD